MLAQELVPEPCVEALEGGLCIGRPSLDQDVPEDMTLLPDVGDLRSDGELQSVVHPNHRRVAAEQGRLERTPLNIAARFNQVWTIDCISDRAACPMAGA